MAATTEQVWGYRWRSSTIFIVTAMAIALFTDGFLASFIVPILPDMVEKRIGLDHSHTQTITSWLLGQNAIVSLVLRIPLGHFADKSTSKMSWLLWALVASLLGTVCTAMAPSLFVLFASRLVQAISETIIWVVGITVIADVVPIEHIGFAYTTVFMASSAGNSIGPMLSGLLYELAGYWAAWSTAFAIIGLDIVFRLLMIENPNAQHQGEWRVQDRYGSIVRSVYNSFLTETPKGSLDNPNTGAQPNSERAPLLNERDNDTLQTPKTRAAPNFYKCLFRKRIFLSGMYCAFVYSLLDMTFTTTLPLHVRDTFHWGGMATGLMFATMQIPRMLLSPLGGRLKDVFGTRMPLFFAFAALAPLVWLLGVPGNVNFPWADPHTRGPSLYMSTMGLIGVSSSILSGAGSIEAAVAANELGKEYPMAFGPNGGKSRALSITGVAYTLGSFIGPILAGSLTTQFGYYTMNCVIVSAVIVFTCHCVTAGSDNVA